VAERDRRSIGLDLGERRIGVALCDSAGRLATPYEVLARSGSRPRDHGEIARLVQEAGAVRVVVGLPRSLDGSLGPAARTVLEEIEQLRRVLDVPVETWDERLSTVTAERSLRSAGVGGRRRRAVVDQVAATVILQSWLEAEGGGRAASPDDVPPQRRRDGETGPRHGPTTPTTGR
jgi:putative Holliday junction resolvase